MILFHELRHARPCVRGAFLYACAFVLPVGILHVTDACMAQVRAQRLVPLAIRTGVLTAAPEEPGADAAADAATVAPEGASDAAATTTAARDQETRKANRLKKIQQMVFDRRPSTILRLWSSPAESAAAESEANTKTGPIGKAPPGEDAATHSKTESAQTPPSDDATPRAPAPELSEDELEERAFDEQIAALQAAVTLGQWERVREILGVWDASESAAAYDRLLDALASGRVRSGDAAAAQAANSRRLPERSMMAADDVLGLALAAPRTLTRNDLAKLGTILRNAVESGVVVETFVDALQKVVQADASASGLTSRQAARMLVSGGFSLLAGPFLPSLDQAIAEQDHEGLNLLSQHYLAHYEKEQNIDHLEDAWRVTQAVLASPNVPTIDREESLTRAVDLAPRVRDELGQAWLNASFTAHPDRGMEILASIGTRASQGLQNQPMDPAARLKILQLQHTAVEALLNASRERAEDWRDALNLLAGNWLAEAVFSYENDTTTSRGPVLERDAYGNIYYINRVVPTTSNVQVQGRAQPIAVGELLEIVPNPDWLHFVVEDVRPRFDMVFAQLFLKVAEEDRALPYIEQLALSHPHLARSLVDEFLQVWTNNHDPNVARNRTSPYLYVYGYIRQAESIPLTRSKQERNLVELAALVKRLRALPLGELNENLLARAFTTCHSSAEVYELSAMERVFGPVGEMKPETLAALAQQMRTNLNGVWREPSVQQNAQTRRKQKDLEAEVLRGYSVALAAVDDGLKRHPDHWQLHLARVALQHDENNYKQDLEPSSSFTKRRQTAFEGFEKAAELYAAQVDQLEEHQQSAEVYELWYYASLGACDLRNVSPDRQPDLTQPPKIRAAIMALPGEAAERHLAMFANALFTRMSAVNPAVKFRYLRTGIEIVGDHEQAREAKKVYDYYKDLVTEIKLQTMIDGSTVVGHTRPFGVFVNLQHTTEIERESGGFGRYLQNQNSVNNAYNYGRPTADYRDKFEESVRGALAEHFDLLSVTFQADTVHSRALPEYGWRYTPYAYLLLRARGPEVDKLPPIQMDLDFLDTSGYAVIPIESAAIPLDASLEPSDPRPFENLQLTQTLDERQARDGKLIVEVKATALGIVPDLDQLVRWESDDFDIASVDDEGVSIVRFDADSEENRVASERTWLVSMTARENLKERPTAFSFGTVLLDGVAATYQRYVDADLAAVGQQISLEGDYGAGKRSLMPWAALAAGVLGLSATAVWIWRRPRKAASSSQWRLPSELTPFTVLGLLREIEQRGILSEARRAELGASIQRIERHYFSRNGAEQPDLHTIATRWLEVVESRA